MDLILMARGINQSFEVWKKFMETQMFWWKRWPLLRDTKGDCIPDGIDENGNPRYKVGAPEISQVQGSFRPIQFFEFVFPKESPVIQNGKEVMVDNIPGVLAAMGNLHQHVDNLRPEIKTINWFLRKAMNLKKIPPVPEELKKKDKTQITNRFVPMAGIAVYPVGIKEDIIKDWPDYGFRQEGL